MKSVDITLGAKILKDTDAIFDEYTRITLRDNPVLDMEERDCTNGFNIYPGQIIFIEPQEAVEVVEAGYQFLPSRQLLKCGITAVCAYDGDITLCLVNCTNNHVVKLFKGDYVGQMRFF
jgi:dUTPase